MIFTVIVVSANIITERIKYEKNLQPDSVNETQRPIQPAGPVPDQDNDIVATHSGVLTPLMPLRRQYFYKTQSQYMPHFAILPIPINNNRRKTNLRKLIFNKKDFYPYQSKIFRLGKRNYS